MAAKVPATVVTGFLGAGKTTLIRRLLSQAGGRRIALVINEFGDLGVDGEILRGCGVEACTDEDIVELSNGCICCTVADDFIPTLEALLARETPPDHIVIETSGLALPQPLVRAFAWPEIRTRVTVDGVVTVVDGPALADGRFAASETAVDAQRRADDSLDHDTPLAELFADQVACADMIVINKTDLMAQGAAQALADRLAGDSRPGVQVVRTAMGNLPPEIMLGLGAAAEDDPEARAERHHSHGHHGDHDDGHDDHRHGHHHDHDQDHDHGHDAFESFVITRPELADGAAFLDRVGAVIREHGILRLKGFAAVAGKPMRLALQAVGPRVDSYYDRPLDPGADRQARLVVIGRAGLDRAAIAAALGA